METSKEQFIQDRDNQENTPTIKLTPLINQYLLDKSKSDIITLYKWYVRGVLDKGTNAVTLAVLIKKQILGLTEAYEVVSEEIMDKNLIDKNGIEINSATIITKESGVSYNYSVCGDNKWNEINSKMVELKEQLKEREAYLKAIREPQTVVDEATGECTRIIPAVRSGKLGPQITLK